jgi:hypothetical protein
MSVFGSGKVGVPTKAYPIFSRIKHLKEVNNMLSSLRRFSKDEVAQERFKIMKFYEKYGEKACLEAFGVDRKLMYTWRKKFNLLGNLTPMDYLLSQGAMSKKSWTHTSF